MALYDITHRETHEIVRVEAECAQDACAKVGWYIGLCYVRRLPFEPLTAAQRDNAIGPDAPRTGTARWER
jgi:hypothetical protein